MQLATLKGLKYKFKCSATLTLIGLAGEPVCKNLEDHCIIFLIVSQPSPPPNGPPTAPSMATPTPSAKTVSKQPLPPKVSPDFV